MTALSVYLAGSLLPAQSLAAKPDEVSAKEPAQAPPGASPERLGPAAPERVWRQSAKGPIEPGTVPIVLLHAFPFDSAMFQDMMGRLAALPVMLIDLPGQGSSPTIQPVSIEAAAAAVVSSLRALGVSRAVVGGVSMGGYVTLALLRHHPEMLAGGILIGTKAEADSPEAQAARLDMARQVLQDGTPEAVLPMVDKMISTASRQAQPQLVERLRQWARQATPQGIAWAQEAMAGRTEAYQTLRITGLPIHLVAGAEDPLIPLATTDAMVRSAARGSTFTLINDVGHLSPLENPFVTSGLVREAYLHMVQR